MATDSFSLLVLILTYLINFYDGATSYRLSCLQNGDKFAGRKKMFNFMAAQTRITLGFCRSRSRTKFPMSQSRLEAERLWSRLGQEGLISIPA